MSRSFIYPILLSILFSLPACDPASEAQQVVDQAIEAHGGERYQRTRIAFDFRDKHYIIQRKNGLYTYERNFTDSTGQVHDLIRNDTFYREVNGQRQVLPAKQRNSVYNSLNSVVYFALLPFGLNDAAVQKRYLGERTLRGQRYHAIEVTFRPEGGGNDHTDTFVYWIHTGRHTVDYLAYTNEGLRFREAVNSRVVNGIRFNDYINYESALFPKAPVQQLDSLFLAGKLRKLSEIRLENITVQEPE